MEYFWIYMGVIVLAIIAITYHRRRKHRAQPYIVRPRWSWWGWKNRGFGTPVVGAMRSTYLQPPRHH
jgi:hypothetical protein